MRSLSIIWCCLGQRKNYKLYASLCSRLSNVDVWDDFLGNQLVWKSFVKSLSWSRSGRFKWASLVGCTLARSSSTPHLILRFEFVVFSDVIWVLLLSRWKAYLQTLAKRFEYDHDLLICIGFALVKITAHKSNRSITPSEYLLIFLFHIE